MPRTPKPTDPLSAIIDLLADALAARLDFPPRASSAASARAAPATAGARHEGQEPSPARVARLTAELWAYVKSHPGVRIEQIASALGQSTRDLALPAKKLLAKGKIKTKGVKRATRYYPARAPVFHDVGRDSR
jgi:hypothetical protein